MLDNVRGLYPVARQSASRGKALGRASGLDQGRRRGLAYAIGGLVENDCEGRTWVHDSGPR